MAENDDTEKIDDAVKSDDVMENDDTAKSDDAATNDDAVESDDTVTNDDTATNDDSSNDSDAAKSDDAMKGDDAVENDDTPKDDDAPQNDDTAKNGGTAENDGTEMNDGTAKKKGNVFWRVVFVVALIVFVCSLVALGAIAFSYFQGQSKYNEVADTSGFDTEDVAQKELAEVSVDWDALKAVNPDTAAWIFVPRSNINYPIVHGEDNDYYLTHDFDGDAGWLANYGAVFIDYRNNPDWSDQLYLIYGHHMNDGSMFADLAGFTDQARFDECRDIYLLTPGGNFKLRTFAMLHTDADETLVMQNFESPEAMAAYLQDKIDRSVVDPGEIPAASDITKAFALATCDNMSEDGRYILYAYVDKTSAEGLTGVLGISSEGDGAVGFANGLEEASGQAAA